MNYKHLKDGRKHGADLLREEFLPHAPKPVFVPCSISGKPLWCYKDVVDFFRRTE